MTYIPQPGTIAARVVEHLRGLGPDVELTSQVLLESIGQPSDWHGLGTSLAPALDHGLIAKRVEGRRAFWRLAGEREAPGVDIDRVHAHLEDHTGIDDPEPNSRPRVATAAETVLRVRTLPAKVALAETLPEAPTCTKSQAEPACEFAITSTGRLLIDTGAQQVALSKAQAEQLMAYLDAQRGVEWEAA